VSAYLPDSGRALAAAAAIVVTALALALLVTRMRRARLARTAAWALALAALAAADRVTAAQPPGFRMLVLIASLFYAMKAVASVEAAAGDGTRLGGWRWIAFATLWPGMRPALFARLEPRRPRAWPLVLAGMTHLAVGLALFGLARVAWHRTGSALVASVALLPALSLLLHFGVFGVAAGLWRLAGVDTAPPFRAPWRATSLGEFWGRRWNVAFSEMTASVLYRPLARAAGRRAALLASFVLSGLLHEAAISLPVGAGFGGPLAYFAIHGLLMTIEEERGPFGRWGTLAAIVAPLPLLFHPPFLRGVVWPLLT
jgi:hypothetical protein